MKKIETLVLIMVLLVTSISFAQEELENQSSFEPQLVKKHEVKLNGLMLLAGAFEGFYEYNLNEESSAGFSAFIAFSDDLNDYAYISPYYRIFFGKKYAAGFFFEGFGMLNTYETETDFFGEFGQYTVTETEKNIDFALGLGLGGKWVTSRNFVFEINAGVGRNLFNANAENDTQFRGKLGFNIGYRF
jgi:hypothetical protein